MDRRTFLSSLSALLAVPFLPATATATAAPASLTPHFATAKMLARCHDRASPEMLARLMRLDGDTANGLYRLLIDRQVITPGAQGVAHAINPLNRHCVTNEVRHARSLIDKVKGLKDRFQRMSEHRNRVQTDAQSPQEEPISDADQTAQHSGETSHSP